MPLLKRFSSIPLLFALLTGSALSQAIPQLRSIEIRLVSRKPSGGPILLAEAGSKRVEVERETLLGPSDFASVGHVKWTEGRPGFDVGLTVEGSKKYERVSAENGGRSLAIIVGGKILTVPKILDPVKANGFLLTVQTEVEAKELSALLRKAVQPR